MASDLKLEESLAAEIDMERVVADADYRRMIISRLRRERMQAQAQRLSAADALDGPAGEED